MSAPKADELANTLVAKAKCAPALIDRRGPMYRGDEVTLFTAKLIRKDENYFSWRAKNMSNDITAATEQVDAFTDALRKSVDEMIKKESELLAATKTVSGSVRSAADKIGQGIAKVEKAADFDRLERLVSLLERAASAMETLSELEKAGSLEGVSAALSGRKRA